MKRLALIPLLLAPMMLAAQAPERPAMEFSSIFNGNFQVRTDSAAKAATGGKPNSKFEIARAYLTFRMPAGDRANIRITTDIYQQTGGAAAYYGGWVVRLKYGILQYDYAKDIAGAKGFNGSARIGMLQTVTIEHIETFWPRWMGTVALESNGFFASADAGAANHFTLPSKLGEVYTTITNGPGYTAAENDRFKDIATRVSFTPFANDSGFHRSFTVSPWYYKGSSASLFVLGGGAQVGPVSDGLQKDRRGIFVGLRERKLTLGAEYAQRLEDIEGGANTIANPRTVRDRTSNLVSAFGIVRPAELLSAKRSRLALIGRVDQFKLDSDAAPEQRFIVAGVLWELNQRINLALDYQGLSHADNPNGVPVRTLFLHWNANF